MEQKQLVSFPQVVEDNLYISSDKLDIVALSQKHDDPAAGAVVTFNGTVRNNSLGKEVDFLFYEAAETMANKMIKDILAEAKQKWDILQAFAAHRIGNVYVGESAVFVITASKHRKEAYEANRYIIEKIKHELPLWKCEYFTDGTKQWGGNCNCQETTGDPHIHIYD